MKKTKILLILIITLFSALPVTSCSFLYEVYDFINTECNHIMVTDHGYEPTCTEEGLTEGAHCFLCNKVLKEQKKIIALGHTEVVDEAIEPRCTSSGVSKGAHCSVCGEITLAQEYLPALGHKEIIIEEKTISTCNEPGLTEKTQCEICNKTIKDSAIYIEKHTTIDHKCSVCELDFSNVDLYRGNYGYDYLGTLKKGKKMQAFYEAMYKVISTFHTDTSIVIPEENIKVVGGKRCFLLDPVSYTDHGLTYDEASLTYYLLQKDSPLFYWLNSAFRHEKNLGVVWPSCIEEYGIGENRKQTNDMVYDAVEEYTHVVATETKAYNIALGYHDAIINSIDYAYGEDGTPLVTSWTGSIVGVFDKRGAVCEGFSEALHLLLNFSKVENIYYEGSPEEGDGHAWNMVRLDDGNWYWIDVTWDDRPNSEDEDLYSSPYVYFPHGIGYQFFCVNDTQYVDKYDGYDSGEYEQNFMTEHGKYVAHRNIPYPERPESVFASEDILELRETFTLDGCTYALIGYKKVQLVFAEGHETLIIPERVFYENSAYDVISAGGLNDSGLIDYMRPVTFDAEKVVIPQSVTYVWRGAFEKVSEIVFK